MIARSPVWTSWQNTTCSCPAWVRASDGVGTPGGSPGALPWVLLTNTFVTDDTALVPCDLGCLPRRAVVRSQRPLTLCWHGANGPGVPKVAPHRPCGPG